ncbi:glycosyl hydrolases family 18 domain-containing protein [Phthorimaea operculella]|nr:glycosyl hydrolases family 18 domain-containing protein [Phthorimaea operculella]
MGVIFNVLTLLFLSAFYVVSSEKNVVCYYGTWATYRHGNGKFDVQNVNPYLCTHLIYAFVGIDNQGNVLSLDSYLDLPENWGRDNFGKFNALKQKNPKLKTLLAVGGWNEGSAKYSIMAADANRRKNFISSALKMVQNYGFDGFDLDWEYPNRRDTVHGQADIDNFSTLVKELKAEFSKYGLIVTAAVSSVGASASLSYDVQAICQYLDIVNLMAYDIYGPWDTTTGHNAALHIGYRHGTPATYAVDVAVEYWLDQGCPSEKLAIGVPFYGRTFTLSDPNFNYVGASAGGVGIAGPYTATAGTIGYNEFCVMLLADSGWEVRYDEESAVPYAFNGRNWVSYDDANSITKKVEWGLTKNVGGIMLWSIETDDFNGLCGEDFPLLRAINKALGRNVDGNEVESTTAGEVTATEGPTVEATTEDATTENATTEDDSTETPTTDAPTTEGASSPPDSVCVVEGIRSNPNNCASFLMCIRDAHGELYPVVFKCPAQTLFDPEHLFCDFSQNAFIFLRPVSTLPLGPAHIDRTPATLFARRLLVAEHTKRNSSARRRHVARASAGSLDSVAR